MSQFYKMNQTNRYVEYMLNTTNELIVDSNIDPPTPPKKEKKTEE